MQDKYSKNPRLARDFNVLIGAFDLDNKLEAGRSVATVKSIHIHPDWDLSSDSFDADLAVLVLANEVSYGSYVQPICLLNPQSSAASIDTGIVAGYGKSEDESKIHEKVPKMMKVPIHENSDCFLQYPGLAQLSSRRTFCAGYANGTGVCSGDGGSGLMVNYAGAFYLRGLVSSSLFDYPKGCDVNAYAVYTDMLNFYDWLNGISTE